MTCYNIIFPIYFFILFIETIFPYVSVQSFLGQYHQCQRPEDGTRTLWLNTNPRSIGKGAETSDEAGSKKDAYRDAYVIDIGVCVYGHPYMITRYDML